MAYFDDNFGEWQMEDQDDLEFYRQVQRTNVRKKCRGCGKWVKIQPDYAYCDPCCRKLESGQDLG